MIQFIHWDGKGSIEIDDNGSIIISVENNDALQKLIESEILKGIPYLEEFKQAGVPGKIRAFRKIENDKDIIAFLEYIRDGHSQYYIRIQEEERYTLLKWNGEYGDEAKFIVRDNATKKQSLFTPGECHNLFWFHSDLANDFAVSHWQGFGNETFSDLEEIAF